MNEPTSAGIPADPNSTAAPGLPIGAYLPDGQDGDPTMQTEKFPAAEARPYRGDFAANWQKALEGGTPLDLARCSPARPDPAPDGSTTEEAVDMLRSRHAAGLAKYGVTLDRTDLTAEQWSVHHAEELADALGYVLRNVKKMRELQTLVAYLQADNARLRADNAALAKDNAWLRAPLG